MEQRHKGDGGAAHSCGPCGSTFSHVGADRVLEFYPGFQDTGIQKMQPFSTLTFHVFNEFGARHPDRKNGLF